MSLNTDKENGLNDKFSLLKNNLNILIERYDKWIDVLSNDEEFTKTLEEFSDPKNNPSLFISDLEREKTDIEKKINDIEKIENQYLLGLGLITMVEELISLTKSKFDQVDEMHKIYLKNK